MDLDDGGGHDLVTCVMETMADEDDAAPTDADYLLNPTQHHVILPTLKSLRPTLTLTSLPTPIGLLTSLTFLELGSCPNLTHLPSELSQCVHLRILFIKGCRNMCAIPPVLGEMPGLTRLGLKSNGLRIIEGKAIPPNVEHLILTDNEIKLIDHEAFVRLGSSCRKLMLSHNKLTTLGNNDDDITLLQQLELIRLSNNLLENFPTSLFLLPKVAWVAISGNPKLSATVVPPSLSASSSSGSSGFSAVPRVPTIDPSELVLDSGASVLGSGASGNVVHGQWKGKEVAVKIFHAVTSDGLSRDEMAIQQHVGGGRCNHLVAAIGVIRWPGVENRVGVVMEMLPMSMTDLALPPTIEEVIEDRWQENEIFIFSFVVSTLRSIAEALKYLHNERSTSHGDVYAHNIVVNRQGSGEEASARLLDLGAAYYYGGFGGDEKEQGGGEGEQKKSSDNICFEKIEVRAFGVLMEELLERCSSMKGEEEEEKGGKRKLMKLMRLCLNENVCDRPTFIDILNTMKDLSTRSKV